VIDSANHIETADSSIVYDPSDRAFGCNAPSVLYQGDDKTQLFVSYGPKTDTELLLNYGFYRMYRAPKVTTAVRDQQRRRLAEAFQTVVAR
jgi:hypothetical protein